MNPYYSDWYLYDHPRHPAMFGSPYYPVYGSFYPPYIPPTQYPPHSYSAAIGRMSAHRDRIPGDEDFYRPLSGLYQAAEEPELDQLLKDNPDSILKADPFSNPISLDFGFGTLRSLADYGVDKTKIKYRDTFHIDDLYLFEAALRLDDLLSDKDRLQRWNQRLKWENIAGLENKREQWSRMTELERACMGLGSGGCWAYQLFGLSIGSTYGYYRKLIHQGGLLLAHPDGFRKGKVDARYPLTGELKVRFPFWRDGGLGLGRSFVAWVADRPARPPPADHPSTSSQNMGQGGGGTEAELVKRRLAAQRRISQMISTIMSQSSRLEPAYRPAGHPHHCPQRPACPGGIYHFPTSTCPCPIIHPPTSGVRFGSYGPYYHSHAYAGCSGGHRPRASSCTEASKPPTASSKHMPKPATASTSQEMPKPALKTPWTKLPASKEDPAHAVASSSIQKKVKLQPRKLSPLFTPILQPSKIPSLTPSSTHLQPSKLPSLTPSSTHLQPPLILKPFPSRLPKAPHIYTPQNMKESLHLKPPK